MRRLLLLLFLYVFTSCVEGGFWENLASHDVASMHEVSFTMEIAGVEAIQTRSVLSAGVESKISDLTLASYGPDGMLTQSMYYDSGFDSMMLSVADHGRSNIYALVNMGDMSHSFPVIEAEVSRMEYYVQSYYAIDNKGFPMSGVLKGFSPESSRGTVTVSRLFAKLCVRVTHKGLSGYSQSVPYAFNMCNKSLYVRQANRRLLPFSDQGSKALKSTDILGLSDSHQNLNDRNAYQGLNSQIGPGPGYVQDTTLVFYVPENVQGNLLPDNHDPYGKVYEKISDIDGKSYSDLCTYLEFNARRENTLGYSGEVMYRYYLGADNTSDFSLVRNKRYDITLDFTEDGFFAESWKVTRGEDWSDPRLLKFLGETFTIQPGGKISIMVHYHRAGLENVDSQNIPGDWKLDFDEAQLKSAGLSCRLVTSGLVLGKNGCRDFCIEVSASKDAVVGTSVPVAVKTNDGEISDQASISVTALSDFSPSWSFRPEYVAQEGVLSFTDLAESDLPLSVSLSDGSKVSCTGVSESSFRIMALEAGSSTISFRNASGSKNVDVQLDIKAPRLMLDASSFLLNPDGEAHAVTYAYRDEEGRVLSHLNQSVFDSTLLPVVETRSCFTSEVNTSSISMKVVSFDSEEGSLAAGGTYSAIVRASGCKEVVPKEMSVMLTDPFDGMPLKNYGRVDDYTLFAHGDVETVLKDSFKDEIDANQCFEYQVDVPDARGQYVSVALEPEWTGGFSNPNDVFQAELNLSEGKVRLGYNTFSSSARHSAGRHNLMMYVTNRYSGEKIGRSCGTLDVYVHTAIGAKAVFGSQKCGYNPYGNETFATVYNRVAGRTVYSSVSSSAIIHYADVSLEWMTDVSQVYVWNRMKTAALSGASAMDALDIVRPSVLDGELNSNTRMLYSVMNGSDSRISVGGEKYGPRRGIGRVLYRALLQAVYGGVLGDEDLKSMFFGYQSVTGKGTPSMAPCYTLHDMNKGADTQYNKVISRGPYYFSPSSCGGYVDEQGRGYHVIHFLEEISPGTYGWINLL